MAAPRIRVGVGGWTYEPWRDNFYPAGWPQARELEYASRRLSAIEINGTYYSTQSAKTFAKWCDSTPDDFIFSLKASRFATNRRVLAEAGESVARFIGSGITELGPKLGPIVWQFAPNKRFDATDFGAFLKLLPARADGLPLRHVMDVRHDSFKTPQYLALARRHGVATVLTESDDYPALFDAQADLVYARIMRTEAALAEAGESVARFIGSGITELGPKLGPIVWQFATTKRFDPVDFEAFLKLLPAQADGLPLRHVMDVRHESFKTPEYQALARRHGVATVLTESDDYPALFDARSTLVYARIMRTEAALPDGITPQALDALAGCARLLQSGGLPSGMPLAEAAQDTTTPPREVFVFFISGAKERAPAAAMALLQRLD